MLNRHDKWTSAQVERSSENPSAVHVVINALALHHKRDGARAVLDNLIGELPTVWPNALFSVLLREDAPPVREHERVEVLRLKSARVGFRRVIYELVRLPRLIGRLQPDLMLSPNESIPLRITVPVILIAQNLIYHCEAVGPLTTGPLIARVRSRLQFAFYRWQMPRAYRRADAVIAVSRHAAKELMLRAGLDDSRVWIVPNGADRLPLRPARRPRTPRRLLYVGALARYKRLNVAIEALRLLRERREEYELTLVGEEWPGYGDIVIANARQAGVRDAVQWLGAVSDETLADLFASAHVSLNLSVCESFGIPTLEAMRAGVPVVVADEPWSAEVVASGGVRVAGDDPRAVADAIESLDDEHEWMRRAVDGRRIAERFTWRETARGVAQVCAEVSEREDKLKHNGPSRKRTDTS